MNPSGLPTELVDLTAAVREATATPDQIARLRTLVTADRNACRFYIRQMHLAASLHWSLAALDDLTSTTTGEPQEDSGIGNPKSDRPVSPVLGFLGQTRAMFSKPVLWSIGAVGVAFAAYITAITWGIRDRAPQVANSEFEPVATITDSIDARWSGPVGKSAIRNPRPEIAAGQPLSIQSGLIELQLASGTTLVIEGPAEWSIDGDNKASLRQGKLVARVPQQAIGFTVETPAGAIVDLGTEFGVTVAADGSTEVHVLQGLVETRSNPERAAVRTLSAGQALRFDSATPDGATLSADTRRFARNLSDRRGPEATIKQISLPLAEILPGSEVATIVANGDFEDRGTERPPGSGQFPNPQLWQRNGPLFAGAMPANVLLPSVFRHSVALASLDDGSPAGIYEQPIVLQPNTEYVLSAYFWNFGGESHHASANVDLHDAPGEANLRLGHKETGASNGRFAYQRFDTRQTGTKLVVRLFFDGNTAPSSMGTGTYDLAWDHIAITKASRFLPPRLRPLVQP